ncbi:hypothetical protein E1B28_009874 [Marasmius oreades]|uniref:Uncharacterized protein n=1 Tax=Marasmius oreades TaxID=181124 RepID=A0A9P7RWP4_9AGAR|nr:uncharacterized protein E1B28_009874 [Marasmius oreades]KAG7090790.1 hypothetical protein E1B28_009874 [Marasmius oreades]
MHPPSGIVHTSGVQGNHAYLPLEEIRAEVLIVDVSARVILTQVFSNPSDHPTSRAVYYFPVPANAAVCGFEMSLSDGRVVRATCKEKTQAEEDFETALSQGRQAAMLEWVSDDVFTISVGAIPPRDNVKTKLTFVMNLLNEDVDEVRFQLPTHVGERYGDLPQPLVGASSTSSSTRVRINIDVQTSGTIRSTFSPSHAEFISITPYSTHLNRPSRRRSTIKFRSREYLDRDFVLIIHADKLDKPRCFAELEGNPDHKATLALQFTVIPKFSLPPIQSQEYIFVIDRSGSMQGSRIEQAKRTLTMLIRMLPTERTTFNIFSFGHDVDGMWNRSVQYTQATLDLATRQIEEMSANYGGTKIQNALEAAINSRHGTAPAAVFVLTDGEVWDDQEMANSIVTSVQSLAAPSSLKVHVLGIGNSVSTQMCQDIARAGNGVCLFATEAEDIVGSCIRLLTAGRTPHVRDVSIDWGVPREYLDKAASSTVNFSSISHRTIRIKPPPALQQAPTQIEGSIHAGTRMVIFAILTLRNTTVPKEVSLRGRLDGSTRPFELVIPIRGVQLRDSEPGLPMIHVLAASRLIDEHDKNRAPLPLPVDLNPMPPDQRQLRKAAIVRLGERYQLASRYTSFVAVDEGQNDGQRSRSRFDFGNWDHDRSEAPELGFHENVQPVHETPMSSPLSDTWIDVGQDAPSPVSESAAVPGAWLKRRSRSSFSTNSGVDEGYETDKTFTTLSSLESCSSQWSGWTTDDDEPALPLSEEDARIRRCPSPLLVPLRLAPESARQRLAQQQPQLSQPVPQNLARQPIGREIFDVATLQLCDGSYPLNDKLRSIVGSAAADEHSRIIPPVPPTAWATALAVAFITKHLLHRKELSNDITLKSRKFLETILGGEELIRRARSLVV